MGSVPAAWGEGGVPLPNPVIHSFSGIYTIQGVDVNLKDKNNNSTAHIPFSHRGPGSVPSVGT